MFQVKSNYEIKDVDEKKGIVTGYASIFGNVDSDGDMVMPGAFLKTIQERGPASAKPRIKHLWQHSSWDVIGIPMKLEEDERGLLFMSQFGKDPFSQGKLQQHIDGLITELSIGYNRVKTEDVLDGDGKLQYRKLQELKLWEYSSVTWGANSLTEVISAKGETADIMANLNKRLDALGRALKNGKYTDESCEAFEAEIMKIKAVIGSLKVITEPVQQATPEITEPDSKAILESILTILKS